RRDLAGRAHEEVLRPRRSPGLRRVRRVHAWLRLSARGEEAASGERMSHTTHTERTSMSTSTKRLKVSFLEPPAVTDRSAERFAGCTYELYHFPDLANLYPFT